MFEKLRDKPLASSQERFETLIGRTTQIYGRLVLVDSVRILKLPRKAKSRWRLVQVVKSPVT